MVEPPEPGVQTCMKCGWKFVSPDPERLRRCPDCKQTEDVYQPRTGTVVLEGLARLVEETNPLW